MPFPFPPSSFPGWNFGSGHEPEGSMNAQPCLDWLPSLFRTFLKNALNETWLYEVLSTAFRVYTVGAQ